MPQILIHDGHPDIIDAIVRHLVDVDTLLALRQCCRALRAGVDSALYAHVELHSLPRCSRARSTPSEPALVMALPASSHIKVPSPTFDTRPQDSARLRAREMFPVLPFNPAPVRSLDLVTVYGLTMAQVRAFAALHTLRTDYGLDGGPSAFQPHTLVHTVWVEHGERLVLAPSVQRLVLQVSFVGPIWDGGARHQAPPLDLVHQPEDLVFAFAFAYYPIVMTTYHQVAAWLLRTLLSARTTSNRTITIVGLEVLLERNDEDFASWLYDNRERFTAKLDCDTRAALALVDDLLSRARFLTRPEWQHELGDRRTAEGAVLSPMRGPLVSSHSSAGPR